MFRTYYFCEMPYAYPPGYEFADVTRTTMPNRWVDPDATHSLYEKYFDLIRAADEHGLDVMFNEHHETLSNLNAAMPLSIAVAARETKNCRLLALGNPVANRPDPVRVATEMAMIDVLSHGRLDCGFVKGSPYELSATNAPPTDMTPRLYEAVDLILKAWTTHDGAFNWEGDYFHHREVSIVPRPYQQPHPPVWITSVTPSSVPAIAQRGYVLATMLIGTEPCTEMFRRYREEYAKHHGAAPHPDNLAYSGIVCVGDTDEEALRDCPKIQDFFRQSFRAPAGSLDLPGYIDPNGRAAMMRAGAAQGDAPNIYVDRVGQADPLDLIDKGIAFVGSPDSVFEQLKTFFYEVGGLGSVMGLFHGSTLTYESVSKSMRLFAKEVLPRFRAEVYDPWIKDHGLERVLLPKSAQAATGAARRPAVVAGE
jgi:alkanesulfonate monooxygenase SsuD/methylene tetrahydromethanopterin reductase-like flavin-dependent oxidoreductase (luciferase family)